MADALGTTVTIRGDSSSFKASMDQDIASLREFGDTLNTTNRAAVDAFRSESEGLRNFGVQAGVTKEQLEQLNTVINATNERIAASGAGAEAQWGRTTTTMARGAFMVSNQSELMGRGLVTMVSSAAMMIGGPWAAAIAVGALAIARLFEKSDEGFKAFDENLKTIQSHIETLMPEGMEHGMDRLQGMLDSNMKLRAALLPHGEESPVQLLINWIKLNELAKERKGLNADIVAIAATALPAKQREMQEEAYHTQLLTEQRAIMKDMSDLDKSKSLGETIAVQTRLTADLAEYKRLVADIERKLVEAAPHNTLPEGAAQKLGAPITAFQDTLNQHDQGAADALLGLRSEKLEADARHAAGAVSDVLEEEFKRQAKARPTFLQTMLKQLGMDEAAGPQHGAFVDPVTASMEAGMRKGEEYRKQQEKINKAIAAGQGTVDHTFAHPDLTEWTKFQKLIHAIGEEFTHTADLIKNMSTAQMEAYKVLAASSANMIATAVAARKESIAALTAAALQPVVSEIEGYAIKFAAAGAAEAVTGNFVAAAGDFAAAGLLTTAAHEVASLASGLTTHGGSSGGGGGSSGTERAPLGTSGIGALGAQRSGQAALTLEVIITNKAPDGKTLQRERQVLQRLDDRDVPYRMAL